MLSVPTESHHSLHTLKFGIQGYEMEMNKIGSAQNEIQSNMLLIERFLSGNPGQVNIILELCSFSSTLALQFCNEAVIEFLFQSLLSDDYYLSINALIILTKCSKTPTFSNFMLNRFDFSTIINFAFDINDSKILKLLISFISNALSCSGLLGEKYIIQFFELTEIWHQSLVRSSSYFILTKYLSQFNEIPSSLINFGIISKLSQNLYEIKNVNLVISSLKTIQACIQRNQIDIKSIDLHRIHSLLLAISHPTLQMAAMKTVEVYLLQGFIPGHEFDQEIISGINFSIRNGCYNAMFCAYRCLKLLISSSLLEEMIFDQILDEQVIMSIISMLALDDEASITALSILLFVINSFNHIATANIALQCLHDQNTRDLIETLLFSHKSIISDHAKLLAKAIDLHDK